MEEVKVAETPAQPAKKQSWWEIIRFGLIALAVVLPVRILVAQPFVVSGASMVPTFENGDYLIIDELSYRLSEPKRLDVVVFRYPGDTKKFFIKRIIGLPGDTVETKNDTVTIYNEENSKGIKLEEPYANLSGNCPKPSLDSKVNLKDGEYFVMGDNRYCSSDSRYWGAVPRNLLVGKPFLRLLPLKEVGVSPGEYPPKE